MADSTPDLSKLKGPFQVDLSKLKDAFQASPVLDVDFAPNEDEIRKEEDLVLKYAQTQVGHKAVGRGQCWDLPEKALDYAKAKTPNDLGNDLYQWGEEISLSEARPGDILQFDNVRVTKITTKADGSWTSKWYEFRPLHSAIVETVGKDNLFTVINQHINKSHKVMRLDLNLSPENVTGTIKAFRPLPKGKK